MRRVFSVFLLTACESMAAALSLVCQVDIPLLQELRTQSPNIGREWVTVDAATQTAVADTGRITVSASKVQVRSMEIELEFPYVEVYSGSVDDMLYVRRMVISRVDGSFVSAPRYYRLPNTHVGRDEAEAYAKTRGFPAVLLPPVLSGKCAPGARLF